MPKTSPIGNRIILRDVDANRDGQITRAEAETVIAGLEGGQHHGEIGLLEERVFDALATSIGADDATVRAVLNLARGGGKPLTVPAPPNTSRPTSLPTWFNLEAMELRYISPDELTLEDSGGNTMTLRPDRNVGLNAPLLEVEFRRPSMLVTPPAVRVSSALAGRLAEALHQRYLPIRGHTAHSGKEATQWSNALLLLEISSVGKGSRPTHGVPPEVSIERFGVPEAAVEETMGHVTRITYMIPAGEATVTLCRDYDVQNGPPPPTMISYGYMRNGELHLTHPAPLTELERELLQRGLSAAEAAAAVAGEQTSLRWFVLRLGQIANDNAPEPAPTPTLPSGAHSS